MGTVDRRDRRDGVQDQDEQDRLVVIDARAEIAGVLNRVRGGG